MGFILKTILALGIGVFLLFILIPLVSFGLVFGEKHKQESERLTRQAVNFAELPNKEKAYCNSDKKFGRNPLPTNVCFCIVQKSIAYPLDKDRKKISAYISKHGTTLTIPKDILLDNFYRGNVSDVITGIKLKSLAKKDKNLPEALKTEYYKQLEALIMKTGVSECSHSYGSDFISLKAYRATKYRYSDIDRTNARINAIKKRRIELLAGKK